MSRAFYDTRSETAAINSDQIPAETLDILQQYFIPPSSLLSPAEKFQDNVYSDHHRVGNTQGIIKQLAGIPFVREIGISFRHPAKSGKVHVIPEVDVLELVVPHKGEADIIRVLTCTLTKSQQIFGAYFWRGASMWKCNTSEW